MKSMTQKLGSKVLLGLLFAAVVVSGCSEADKNVSTSTTVENPVAATFQPKGTIQGKIRDAVTFEPIVNATVSIGLATAVTDDKGQYILANVPATTDALNLTVTGQRYNMTIDLRQVTSPVKMNLPSTTTRYPDFRYEDVEVKYTSLNDTTCDDIKDNIATGVTALTCTNSTNHDTPVDGLVADANVNVGKLAATIKGVVAGCSVVNGDFLAPVGAGFTVNLVNATSESSSSGNSGSGASGRVVATTTTDANGAFTFSNIESNRAFFVRAVDSATAPTKEGFVLSTGATSVIFSPSNEISILSPSDGQTKFLRIQESTAVHVCVVDNHGPEIISVSPETGSDLAPGATTVVFTFSEAIKANPLNSTDASAVDNLFDHIEVNFDGNKAGNTPYTLAFNTALTQLTVSLTTGTSGKYHVRIKDLDTGGRFKDANGLNAVMGVCKDDSAIPTSFGVTADPGATDCSVWFTTNGGPTPATTNGLTVVNAASLNVGSSPILDWPFISGAKKYNLYCRQDQVYQDATPTPQLGETTRVNTADLFASTLTPSLSLVGTGNEHGLQYACFVRGVNSDGVEGPDSNTVTVKDAVGPDFTATGTSGSNTVTVTFTEPVRESDAETLANYVLTGTDATAMNPPVSVSYNTATNIATVTYTGNATAAGLAGTTLTILNVKDLIGFTNLTAPAGNNADTLN